MTPPFSYLISRDFRKNFLEEPENLTTSVIHPDVVPFLGMGIGKKGLPGQKKTPELVDYLKVPSDSISVGITRGSTSQPRLDTIASFSLTLLENYKKRSYTLSSSQHCAYMYVFLCVNTGTVARFHWRRNAPGVQSPLGRRRGSRRHAHVVRLLRLPPWELSKSYRCLRGR